MYNIAPPLKLALIGFLSVHLFMVGGWLASLKLKDASIVDRLWGLNFVLLALIYLLCTNTLVARHYLILALVTVWGIRLFHHIHTRNRGYAEDYRYQKMRRQHGKHFWWYSFFSVFFLQGTLSWLISAPIFWIFAHTNTSLSYIDSLAFLVWCLGFYFEAVGDLQLKKFKADPKNKGQLLTQGLWSLCRHPNYFGDALQWWALFLFALGVPGGWQSCFGPLIMSIFLRYISGVTLLEKNLRHSKPDYAAYIANTPAFIPKCKFRL